MEFGGEALGGVEGNSLGGRVGVESGFSVRRGVA